MLIGSPLTCDVQLLLCHCILTLHHSSHYVQARMPSAHLEPFKKLLRF